MKFFLLCAMLIVLTYCSSTENLSKWYEEKMSNDSLYNYQMDSIINNMLRSDSMSIEDYFLQEFNKELPDVYKKDSMNKYEDVIFINIDSIADKIFQDSLFNNISNFNFMMQNDEIPDDNEMIDESKNTDNVIIVIVVIIFVSSMVFLIAHLSKKNVWY